MCRQPYPLSNRQLALVDGREALLVYRSTLRGISHHPLYVNLPIFLFFLSHASETPNDRETFTTETPGMGKRLTPRGCEKNNTHETEVKWRIYRKHLYGIDHSFVGKKNGSISTVGIYAINSDLALIKGEHHITFVCWMCILFHFGTI